MTRASRRHVEESPVCGDLCAKRADHPDEGARLVSLLGGPATGTVHVGEHGSEEDELVVEDCQLRELGMSATAVVAGMAGDN